MSPGEKLTNHHTLCADDVNDEGNVFVSIGSNVLLKFVLCFLTCLIVKKLLKQTNLYQSSMQLNAHRRNSRLH